MAVVAVAAVVATVVVVVVVVVIIVVVVAAVVVVVVVAVVVGGVVGVGTRRGKKNKHDTHVLQGLSSRRRHAAGKKKQTRHPRAAGSESAGKHSEFERRSYLVSPRFWTQICVQRQGDARFRRKLAF